MASCGWPAPDGDGRPTRTGDGSASPPGRAILDPADRRGFERLAARLPGREGVALSAMGRAQPVEHVGALRTGAAWSTAKVPIVMARLDQGSRTNADIRASITVSSNGAAERVFREAGGSEPVTRQLRMAGDQRTVVEQARLREGFTAFGQTDWALDHQARFLAGLPCADQGKAVLSLMSQVTSEQRWGLTTVDRNAAIKSGWGPGRRPGADDGWLDRQMGVIDVDGRPVAVSLATEADDHASGIEAINALARWVAAHVDARALPRGSRCGSPRRGP